MAQVFKVISRGLASTPDMSPFKHITVMGCGLMGSGIAQVIVAPALKNMRSAGTEVPTPSKYSFAKCYTVFMSCHRSRGLGLIFDATGVDRYIAISVSNSTLELRKEVAAQSDQKVIIVDVKENLVIKAQESILASLKRVAKKAFKDDRSKGEEFVKTTLGNISYSTDVQESVKSTDLVIDAVTEYMPMKHTLFTTIDAVAPKHTIFASNTSSLSITEIASVTERKDRFGGLHFFNPVPVMKLLEVIRTEDTSQETYERMIAWGQSIGKTCITCKDTPGFVVNRLLVPQLAEAIKMLEIGVSTSKDIDIAMKLGAGHPMGPFEVLDYIGLDTFKLILDGWHQKYPDVQIFKPPKILIKLVSEAKFGRKSGEGFYKYKK